MMFGSSGFGAIGLGPAAGASLIKGGGVPEPLPISATLLEPFEATTGWTNGGSHTLTADPALAVQGVNAIRFDQTSTQAAVDYYKSFAGMDAATLGAVAVYAKFDDDYDWQCVGAAAYAIRLGGAGTIYNLASVSGVQQGTTGGRWLTGVASSTVIAGGVGNHQIRFRNTPTGAKTGQMAYDAAYTQVQGQARVILSFDDACDEAYTVAFPIMQALGLVGVLNIPTALVGNSGKLTWGQIAEMHAAGWGVQIDGTTDDGSMIALANPAAVVAGLDAMADDLVSRGFPRPIGFCYPNGQGRSDGPRIERDSVTTSGTIVTVADTTGIAVGMRFVCFGAPRTARVASIGSGEVTLNEAVTTGVTAHPASFVDDSGAFHGFKLQQALLDAGYVFGRGTNSGKWFTQFGIAPRESIYSPGTSTTGMTLATFQAAVNLAIETSSNVDIYSHFWSDAPAGGSNLKWASLADAQASMEWLAARVQDRTVLNPTYAKLYALDSVATPPA